MTQKAQERLYLTKDRKSLVAEGDRRAATLYTSPGDEIPDSAVKKFGLVDGRLKGAKTPEGEASLTQIKGIGNASAKALVAAGVDTVAKLATIDPDNPPDVEGLAGSIAWNLWIEEAKSLADKGGK